MDNVKRTEKIAASGPNKGPRVNLDTVLGSIADTHWINAGDALFKLGELKAPYDKHPTSLMTICLCVLHNGWIVVGKSAPASAANYDPEVGRKLSHEDCIRQIWPLLGFNLRQNLHEELTGDGKAKGEDGA